MKGLDLRAAARILALAALSLFVCAAPARAGFADGLAAYDAGDFRGALEAWRPLAEAGDGEAQVALAGLYGSGLGVPADLAEAARWYRRAAEQGEAIAQLNLGDLHARGAGVPRDLVQAYLWLSLAAAQGRRWPAQRRREIATAMTETQLAEAQRLVESWRAAARP
jgi:TPR repeat protein